MPADESRGRGLKRVARNPGNPGNRRDAGDPCWFDGRDNAAAGSTDLRKKGFSAAVPAATNAVVTYERTPRDLTFQFRKAVRRPADERSSVSSLVAYFRFIARADFARGTIVTGSF